MKFYKNVLTFIVGALFLFSGCNDHGNESVGNDQASQDVAKGMDDLGKETTASVRGRWRVPSAHCKGGFGICEVKVDPEEGDASVMDSSSIQEQRNAIFKFDLNNRSQMEIEFLEEIPYFSTQFLVESPIEISNLFGYNSIVIKPGRYITQKKDGHGFYGSTKVNIETKGAN